MDESICQLMNFQQITLQWIEKMLFYDKVRLKDIPTEIRATSADIYIVAFHRNEKSRSNEKQTSPDFVKRLKIS